MPLNPIDFQQKRGSLWRVANAMVAVTSSIPAGGTGSVDPLRVSPTEEYAVTAGGQARKGCEGWWRVGDSEPNASMLRREWGSRA